MILDNLLKRNVYLNIEKDTSKKQLKGPKSLKSLGCITKYETERKREITRENKK